MVISAVTAHKPTNLTSFKGNQNAKQVVSQSGSKVKPASHSSRYLLKVLLGIIGFSALASSCSKHETEDIVIKKPDTPVVKPPAINEDSLFLRQQYNKMSQSVLAIDSTGNKTFESVVHKVLTPDGQYLGDMETKTISITADTIKAKSSMSGYESIIKYCVGKDKDGTRFLKIANGSKDSTGGAVRLIPDGKSFIGTDLKKNPLMKWTSSDNYKVLVESGYPKLKAQAQYLKQQCKMMIK